MKFKDGYMISSGQPVNEYIDSAVRHVLLRQVSNFPFLIFVFIFFHAFTCHLLIRVLSCCTGLQGVLGIKVKIMLDWDPKGKQGPKTPLPDLVTIHPPKEEEVYIPPIPTTGIEVPVAWARVLSSVVSVCGLNWKMSCCSFASRVTAFSIFSLWIECCYNLMTVWFCHQFHQLFGSFIYRRNQQCHVLSMGLNQDHLRMRWGHSLRGNMMHSMHFFESTFFETSLEIHMLHQDSKPNTQ